MVTWKEGASSYLVATGQTVTRGDRLKLSAAKEVSVAGAGEDFDCVSLSNEVAGEYVSAKNKNDSGTFVLRAAGAFSVNALLFGAADGEVDDAVSGEIQFKALTAATAADDFIEAIIWGAAGAGDNRFTSINDVNDAESINITATASAVNKLTVINAATGTDPQITATGTDTDVGLVLKAKGAGVIAVGVDGTGHDVKLFGDTASAYALWDQSADTLQFDLADILMGDNDLVKWGDASDLTMTWDGTQFVIDALTADSAIHIGVDGAGLDVKFFGDTASSYMLWDQTADALIINAGTADLGTSCEADAYTVGGVAGADFNGAVTNLTAVKGIVTAAS